MNAKVAIARWGVGLAVALASLCIPAHAQQPTKVARVGFLSLEHEPGLAQLGVVKALRALGYIDGQSVVYEVRYADWHAERLPELTNDLVRSKVDVIVPFTNIPAFAAKRATERVPLVVWGIHAAVDTGLVRSLARPGGNVTGTESLAPELDVKRLALIKEILPRLLRLGVVYNPDDQGSPFHLASVRGAARGLGVRVVLLPVRRLEDFDVVLNDAAAESIDALLTLTDEVTGWNWEKLASFTMKHRLPSVCEFRYLAQSGCLLTHGPTYEEFAEVVARQVDKVLKGAKASDLPVEQVKRFETLLNMKTANALGLSIPSLVRLRIDEVIE